MGFDPTNYTADQLTEIIAAHGGLVNAQEAAELLGVDQALVSRQNGRGKLPEPVARIGAKQRPLWTRLQVADTKTGHAMAAERTP